MYPVYRATVYAPRSGSSESTPLRPASGSPHNSDFVVSTKTLSGSFAYMGIPQGKRGTFGLPQFSLEVGQYAIPLFDVRTSPTGSNINRFVTAYLGDTSGSLRLVGRKVYIEESLDDGASFNPFFVGRITEFNLRDELSYEMVVRDAIEELKTPIFDSYPAVQYGVYVAELPKGLTGAVQPTIQRNLAYFKPLTLKAKYTRDYDGQRVFGVLGSSMDSRLNDAASVLTYQPPANAILGTPSLTGSRGQDVVRASISGIGDFQVSAVRWHKRNVDSTRVIMTDFGTIELDRNDSEYTAGASLTLNTTYDFNFYRQGEIFWLSGVNPTTVVRDICQGRFFTRYASAYVPTIAYDTSSLSTVDAAIAVDSASFQITEKMEAIEFLEKYFCRPFSVGMAMEPALSGSVPISQIRFFTTAVPTSTDLTSSITITDADVIVGESLEWSPGRPSRKFVGKYYTDYLYDVAGQVADKIPAQEAKIFDTVPSEVIYLDFADTDTDVNPYEVDFNGIRRVVSLSDKQGEIGDDPETERLVMKLLDAHVQRFQSGPPHVTLVCRRSTNINNCRVGDFVLVEVEVLPNSATHTRGGTRVMQIVGKHPLGTTVTLDLVDVAINQTNATPTLGTITGNGINRLTTSVTSSVPCRLHVQMASVGNGGSLPAAGSPLWSTVMTGYVGSGSQTYTFGNAYAGSTHYIRARAETYTGETKLPSPWATNATGYNQNTISAPSGLTVTEVNRKTALVSWTNTATGSVEVWLASPASSASTDLTRIVSIPPLSQYFRLSGLDLNSSPSHSVAVRYRGEFGGYSTFTSASFVASGSGSVLSALDSLIVYVGA